MQDTGLLLLMQLPAMLVKAVCHAGFISKLPCQLRQLNWADRTTVHMHSTRVLLILQLQPPLSLDNTLVRWRQYTVPVWGTYRGQAHCFSEPGYAESDAVLHPAARRAQALLALSDQQVHCWLLALDVEGVKDILDPVLKPGHSGQSQR